MIDIIHGDSMQAMRGMDDNQFDWSIVDPPYFDAPQRLGYYGGGNIVVLVSFEGLMKK